MNEAIIIAAASRAITDNNFFMADPNNPHFVDRGLEQMNACKWVISHIFSLPLAQRLTDAEEEMVRTKYNAAKIAATECDSPECAEFMDMLENLFGKDFFKEDKL